MFKCFSVITPHRSALWWSFWRGPIANAGNSNSEGKYRQRGEMILRIEIPPFLKCVDMSWLIQLCHCFQMNFISSKTCSQAVLKMPSPAICSAWNLKYWVKHVQLQAGLDKEMSTANDAVNHFYKRLSTRVDEFEDFLQLDGLINIKRVAAQILMGIFGVTDKAMDKIILKWDLIWYFNQESVAYVTFLPMSCTPYNSQRPSTWMLLAVPGLWSVMCL